MMIMTMMLRWVDDDDHDDDGQVGGGDGEQAPPGRWSRGAAQAQARRFRQGVSRLFSFELEPPHSQHLNHHLSDLLIVCCPGTL